MSRRMGGVARLAGPLMPGCIALALAPALISAQNAVPDAASWSYAGQGFVAVSVSDLDASVAWYGQMLDLDVVREIESADGSVRVRLMRGGDMVVELIAHADPIDVAPTDVDQPGFRFLGLFKSGLFVSGIEALHAELLSQGADADARIGTDDVLGMRTFVFRDPDGNRLQAFERCADDCESGS